ncbi:MAG: hypothetical protein C0403_10365 [Desulfobacterium sp.]|nr:hypothetical protein [Desulfobacterium sp.]
MPDDAFKTRKINKVPGIPWFMGRISLTSQLFLSYSNRVIWSLASLRETRLLRNPEIETP